MTAGIVACSQITCLCLTGVVAKIKSFFFVGCEENIDVLMSIVDSIMALKVQESSRAPQRTY